MSIVGVSMKKRVSVIMLSFLCVLLSACNDMKKIEPEKYFTGSQLVLAKAIQAADREAIHHLAKNTDLNSPGAEELTLLFFAMNESFYNILFSRNFISVLARSGQHKVMCWKSSVYLA